VTYSCTKAFLSFLALGLNYELRDKIDVLDYKAAFVKTLLHSYELSFFNIAPSRATKGALRDLGKERTSNGPLVHELLLGYHSL